MADNFILKFDSLNEEYADIKRCLENLYSTRAGSQPMDRSFGIDYEKVVGLPLAVAKNQLALEIISKTETYEPRVVIESVECKIVANTGMIIPTIHIKRVGDVK